MLGYKRLAVMLSLCLNKVGCPLPFDLCVLIALKCNPSRINYGKSSYAKRRRAKAIGRCHRCYRVKPGFYFTKRCDGVTCVPGVTHNCWVEDFIKNGSKGSN